MEQFSNYLWFITAICTCRLAFLIKISYDFCREKSWQYLQLLWFISFLLFLCLLIFQWINLQQLRSSWGSWKNFHKAVLKDRLFTFPHQMTFAGQCLLTQRLPLKLERFPLIVVSLSAVLMRSIQSANKIKVSCALCVTITSAGVALACTVVE